MAAIYLSKPELHSSAYEVYTITERTIPRSKTAYAATLLPDAKD